MRLVVKYGGSAMDTNADDALLEEVSLLLGWGHSVILVHGGGPELDRALADRGLTSRRIDGLRVTDRDALEVAEAVFCATGNKRLVRACLKRGISAVGISGQDGGLLRARRTHSRKGDDLGFVGDIVAVDARLLEALLEAGFLPIVAPIAVGERAESAYNVNADTVAGAIAGAIHADAYVALTNVERVLGDPRNPASAIDALSVRDALTFASSQACATGMRPKLFAAIDAVVSGAKRAYICAARPGAIQGALAGNATVIG